jgi:hypothetical protein
VGIQKITALALSVALVIATTLPAAAQHKRHYKGGHHVGHGHHGHHHHWRGHHRHRGGLSTGAAIGLGLGAAAVGAALAAPYAYGGYSSGGYWANQCQYWDGYVWHWTC